MAKKIAWRGSETLKTMLRPIDKIAEDPRNVRLHSERNIEAIKASLAGFSQVKNVVVHTFAGDEVPTVIAGNGTIQAARALGWTHIACNDFGGTDDEARAFAVADNRTSELAEWDEGALAETLDDLRNIDMLGATGFNEDELNVMLGEFDVSEVEAPEIPDGDRSEYQQMTFTLHDTQVEIVKAAIEKAIEAGPFIGPNESKNGNAIERIAGAYLA